MNVPLLAVISSGDPPQAVGKKNVKSDYSDFIFDATLVAHLIVDLSHGSKILCSHWLTWYASIPYLRQNFWLVALSSSCQSTAKNFSPMIRIFQSRDLQRFLSKIFLLRKQKLTQKLNSFWDINGTADKSRQNVAYIDVTVLIRREPCSGW